MHREWGDFFGFDIYTTLIQAIRPSDEMKFLPQNGGSLAPYEAHYASVVKYIKDKHNRDITIPMMIRGCKVWHIACVCSELYSQPIKGIDVALIPLCKDILSRLEFHHYDRVVNLLFRNYFRRYMLEYSVHAIRRYLLSGKGGRLIKFTQALLLTHALVVDNLTDTWLKVVVALIQNKALTKSLKRASYSDYDSIWKKITNEQEHPCVSEILDGGSPDEGDSNEDGMDED